LIQNKKPPSVEVVSDKEGVFLLANNLFYFKSTILNKYQIYQKKYEMTYHQTYEEHPNSDIIWLIRTIKTTFSPDTLSPQQGCDGRMPNVAFEVTNCPRCRKLFQKTNRNLCLDCCREMDSALIRCLEFLRRNHKVTEEQLTLETGVPSEYIQAWIKEGRLLISDYPNLNYPCTSCGKPIRQNKMCVDCLSRFNQDLEKLRERERSRIPVSQKQGGFQIRDRLQR
jgi:hypothetical protein